MHAGAFEPGANSQLAPRLNDTGRSTTVFGFELRIPHAVAVPVQILEALQSFVVLIGMTKRMKESRKQQIRTRVYHAEPLV